MDERHHELIEAGKAMIEELGNLYGCEANEERIKRAVYKATECGAFIQFPHDAPVRVGIGSIVEGSEAEVSIIWVNFSLDDTFIDRWREAVANVEREATRLWNEANE